MTIMSTRQLVEVHGFGAPGRYALKAAQAIATAVRSAGDRGMPRASIDALRFESITAARREIAALVEQERTVAQKRLDAEKAAYLASERRNIAEHEAVVRRQQLRVSAMLPSELEARAVQMLAGDVPTPDELDIVSAALARSGSPMHEQLRTHALEHQWHEPWRHGATGKDLVSKVQSLATVDPGAVPLSIDGKMAAVDFIDLLDGGDV